jgi:sugar lactone lactonase YvrE
LTFDRNLNPVFEDPSSELLETLGLRYVRGINVFSDDTVWLCTSKGLIHYDHQSNKIEVFESDFNSHDSLQGENVYCCTEDNQGRIWAGTAGRGISILDPKTGKFSHITSTDGLPDDVIYQLVIDSQGTVWAGTNNGLAAISPDGAIKNYNVEDGLQSREFNVGASYVSPEGEIFMGGMNGLIYFYPGEIKKTNINPRLLSLLLQHLQADSRALMVITARKSGTSDGMIETFE